MTHIRIVEALTIIEALGLPRAQQNERSAVSLLALLNLTPRKTWAEAEAPLVGITPVMDWAHEHYEKKYAPNTRETFRRQTMHQFVAAGLVLYNPDKPGRSVNSPKAVYQIEPATLALIRSFGTKKWATCRRSRGCSVRESADGRVVVEATMGSLVVVKIVPRLELCISIL